MKLENKSLKQLKAQAWHLLSEYVRKRDKGSCFTCGVIKEWKEQQSGHYIHGCTKATWLNEDNVHCQCSRCNMYLNGNLRVYTLYMIKKYGIKKVEALEQLSKKEHYFNRKELTDLIIYFKKKLNGLKDCM